MKSSRSDDGEGIHEICEVWWWTTYPGTMWSLIGEDIHEICGAGRRYSWIIWGLRMEEILMVKPLMLLMILTPTHCHQQFSNPEKKTGMKIVFKKRHSLMALIEELLDQDAPPTWNLYYAPHGWLPLLGLGLLESQEIRFSAGASFTTHHHTSFYQL